MYNEIREGLFVAISTIENCYLNIMAGWQANCIAL